MLIRWVLNATARLVSSTHKYDRGLSQMLHAGLHWLDVARLGPVQAWCYSPPMSSQQSATVSGRLLRSSLRHHQSSVTVPHIIVCLPYYAIDVAHSAVGHFQSPDPLSGTCFQTNLKTLTAPSLHSDCDTRHSFSTSISMFSTLDMLRLCAV